MPLPYMIQPFEYSHNAPYEQLSYYTPDEKVQSKMQYVDGKASRVKLFADRTLSDQFMIPVFMDDQTAAIIAIRNIFKEKVKTVWVNGSPEKVENLRLELRLICPPSNTQS